jgi:hypothetical protein
MIRQRKPALLIALLCAIVLVTRLGGAHLHLCLDGSEPPISLHFADSGEHHSGESAAPHADQDVAIDADLLAKKSGGDFDPAVLAFAIAFLLLLTFRATGVTPEALSLPFRSARTRLRPPLRGPPR